ncbi:MAG TPA: HAMP domain-containing sensor histidine kinase [Kofleriaceae bacterium]
METRALIRRKPASRAWYAAALLCALLAALLGAWFFSGWHDVRMRQQEVRDTPRRDAEQRADELARELHADLEALIAREVRRPYFHYQNLMHDPKSIGVSVAPSPLSRNPEDKLVLGYFQIDAKGKATTPTINDDFPDLSEPDNIAGNSAFRRQVVLDLSRALTPPAVPVMVAEVTPKPRPQPRPRPPVVQQEDTPIQQQTQVIKVAPDVYIQNSNSNQVYWQQQLDNNAQLANVPTNIQQQRVQPQQAQTPPVQKPPDKPPVVQTPPVQKPPVQRPPVQRVVKPPPEPPPPVTITVSPLEWRTLAFGGSPTLLAVRHVQTPDGSFAQGFVVDRSALTNRLATKAGEMVAELHADTPERREPEAERVLGPDRGVDLVPGWQLSVSPNPRAIAQASLSAAGIARSFLIRFVAIGSIALLAAAFVLVLVLRAEQLARERSQFAAAAAHELRTPLAGLQLYGDMLADGLGDPGKVRDYARRMSEEASRLGRVVSNVLGFSQLERGNLAVDAQVGALGEELCELAERAQPALDRAGAALELDVSPELRARFDRDALARIVGNLLDNAEKYARNADDRTIKLAARDRGDAVEVTVQDQGPGVGDRTKLFHAFSRGVTADGPAGLGLGLALSQSLAEAMGGKLAYRPSEGKGATFVLELPRA